MPFRDGNGGVLLHSHLISSVIVKDGIPEEGGIK